MQFARILIYLNAAFFVIYGLMFGVSPGDFAQALTGSAPDTVSAQVDFRATYGGMTLAVGVILWMLGQKGQLRLGLWAVAILMACMASGRLLGILIDGIPNTLMFVYLAAEVVVLMLACVGLRQPGIER